MGKGLEPSHAVSGAQIPAGTHRMCSPIADRPPTSAQGSATIREGQRGLGVALLQSHGKGGIAVPPPFNAREIWGRVQDQRGIIKARDVQPRVVGQQNFSDARPVESTPPKTPKVPRTPWRVPMRCQDQPAARDAPKKRGGRRGGQIALLAVCCWAAGHRAVGGESKALVSRREARTMLLHRMPWGIDR